jgi:hypothetical protein
MGGRPAKWQEMMVAKSNYRQRGRPERVMAEIRREILRKISARLKKERTSVNLSERIGSSETNNGQMR